MSEGAKSWASPRGGVALSRWPVRVGDPLQAWDGADTYLIEALEERVPGAQRVLVVDDTFGALATALAGTTDVASWGDSELGRLALEVNAERAGVSVPWAAITEDAPVLTGPPDAVLVRIPKTLRRFKWMLGKLASLPVGTPVLMGAKIKQVQKSHVSAAEGLLGPAQSTLGRHKARLVVATTDGRSSTPLAGRIWEIEPGLHQRALPGVFGEERVDGGTELLLTAIPGDVRHGCIVDLGCGSGALGLVAAARNPDAEMVFRDSSHRAVVSARAGWRASFGDRAAVFEADDVLAGMEDDSADLILCNPPFHQGTEITRRVAAHMFAESSRVLRDGGRLLVVGNRHLGYGTGMGRTLAQVEEIASNKRFAVYEGFRRFRP